MTACKFEHKSKKKVAIVTPEQRTKKRIPNDIFEPLKVKQDEPNLSPSFSSKQLLSSIISKKFGMVNEMIELSDHQIFAMDCKRAVEGLSRYNTCVNNNNEEKDTNFDFVDRNDCIYNCLECEASWPISNRSIEKIVSHFCSKWSHNFLEDTYSPKKHIGKLFDQRQAIAKWKVNKKECSTKSSTNISLLTIIRCRKCKMYFPGSFAKLNDKSAPIDMLLEHSHDCHTKIINEWKHHQSLSIKSLR